MSIFTSGHEVVTSSTKPASPSVGQLIYCTDTDEYLKYVSYGGTNRWMQADIKPQRNFIINGGLDVSQRGTTFNPTNAGVLTGARYGADRWQMAQATSMTPYAFSMSTVNGNLAYWGTQGLVRMWRTNASTSTTPFIMQQSVESTSVIRACRPLTVSKKYLTLGFWCRTFKGTGGTANPFVTAEIITGTGTDSVIGSFTSQTTQATVTTAHAQTEGNFAYYTVSFEVSAVFTQLGVRFTYTPTGTAGDFDVVEISGVQLENGSAPSEFEIEPYETTLRKCQRYYQQYTSAALRGVASSATAVARTAMVLSAPMRVAPTSYSLAGAQFWNGASSGTFNAVSTTFFTPNIVEFDLTATGSSWTSGQAISQYQNSTTQWFSAEL